MKCSVLCKLCDLRLAICACYSWEMATKVDLDASVENIEGWKGIQEKSRKVNGIKRYITALETSPNELSTGVIFVHTRMHKTL
jgi:hypothetical protein